MKSTIRGTKGQYYLPLSLRILNGKTKMAINYLRWLMLWIGEAKETFLTLGIVGIAVIFVFTYPTEPTIRVTGLVVQILGIMIGVFGILKSRKEFGLKQIREKIKDWIQRFPKIRPGIITGNIEITEEGDIWNARARVYAVIKGIDPNTSIDEKIETLKQNDSILEKRIECLEKQIDNEINRNQGIDGKIEAGENARKQLERDLQEKIKTTSTSGLHLSAIGACWLFFGVLLSTASPEISSWLK